MSKLQEMMLYIAQKSQNDPHFGATKLHKILFMADFRAYGLWGKSITDATYQHLDQGPCCKQLKPAQEDLIESQRAKVDERQVKGWNQEIWTQKRLTPLVGADLSSFSIEEVELVDQVIKEFEPFSATALSEFTHTLTPWLVTKNGEEIPYQAVFVLKKVIPSKEDLAWAEGVIAELDLD